MNSSQWRGFQRKGSNSLWEIEYQTEEYYRRGEFGGTRGEERADLPGHSTILGFNRGDYLSEILMPPRA